MRGMSGNQFFLKYYDCSEEEIKFIKFFKGLAPIQFVIISRLNDIESQEFVCALVKFTKKIKIKKPDFFDYLSYHPVWESVTNNKHIIQIFEGKDYVFDGDIPISGISNQKNLQRSSGAQEYDTELSNICIENGLTYHLSYEEAYNLKEKNIYHCHMEFPNRHIISGVGTTKELARRDATLSAISTIRENTVMKKDLNIDENFLPFEVKEEFQENH
ncbi:unnamed protein product [Blepharisma stoltei]|uniref:DRBM domain-containing protein n=1 Tax=Blepharisma stoltei TaxID=1481888 RepID=A0AAU9IJ12_9CILI|nr:unnamed protein product [Blepharisma stoltei]